MKTAQDWRWDGEAPRKSTRSRCHGRCLFRKRTGAAWSGEAAFSVNDAGTTDYPRGEEMNLGPHPSREQTLILGEP